MDNSYDYDGICIPFYKGAFMMANQPIDVMQVVGAVLNVIRVMDNISVSLGKFTFSLWDLVIALGVLETIAFIFGAYLPKLPGGDE